MKLPSSYHLLVPLWRLLLWLAIVGAARATAPKVTSVQFTPRRIQVADQEIELIDAVLSFDQPLYTLNMTSMLSSLSDMSPRIFTVMPDVNATANNADGNYSPPTLVPTTSQTMRYWMRLSRLYSFLSAAPINVACSGQMHVQGPIGQDEQSRVNFFPYSKNYLGAMFDTLLTDDDVNVVMDPAKLVVILVGSVKNKMTGETKITSGVPDFVRKFSSGQCTISIGAALLSDNNFQMAMGVIPVPISARLPTPQCNEPELRRIATEFDMLVQKMVGADAEAIRQVQVQILKLTLNDAWIGCETILKSALVFKNETRQQLTADCTEPFGSPQYSADPCCNKTLSFEQCCAPRTVSRTMSVVAGADAQYLASKCFVSGQQMVQLYSSLESYAGLQNQMHKCTQELSQDGNDMWNKYRDFINVCREKIFGKDGQPLACSSDSDCYTSCMFDSADAISGTCLVPRDDPTPFLERCFIERMDPKIMAALLRNWGVYNATDYAAFSTQLRQRAMSQVCIGPDGWKFSGGWFMINPNYVGPAEKPTADANGGYANEVYLRIGESAEHMYVTCNRRSVCFFLPPSREACESQRVCNWQNGGESCTSDRLENGGKFCGKCSGGSCIDVSLKGRCLLPPMFDLNATRVNASCNAMGGRMVTTFDQGIRCALNNVSDEQGCTSRCMGPSGPRPASKRACINLAVTTATACGAIRLSGSLAIPTMMDYFNERTGERRSFCTVQVPSEMCSQLAMVGFTLVTQPRTIADEAWFNSTQCYREYCFNPSLTRTTCTAALGYFFDHLNEHRGACVRDLDSMNLSWNERKKTCESTGTGWTYFSGVQWTRGRLNTQASCESGACTYDLSTAKLMSEQLVDAKLEINQCDAKGFCNRKCEGCRSLIRGESKVCYHRNQTMCNNTLFWDSTSGRCVYRGDAVNTCMQIQGSTVVQCSDFDNDRHQCQEAYTDRLLSCTFGPMDCRNQTQCAAAGECDDHELKVPMLPNQPVCVLPADLSMGRRDCRRWTQMLVRQSRVGCIAQLLTATQCTLNGGRMMMAARNRTECLSRRACCERGRNCADKLELTDKSETECTRCGGRMVPMFEYAPGRWQTSSVQALQWRQRSEVPVNRWAVDLNMEAFKAVVSSAIGSLMGKSGLMEYRCMYADTLAYMRTVACSCGVSRSADCFVSESMEVASAPLALVPVSCGEATSIQTGGMTVNINASSVQQCDRPAQVKLEKFFARSQSSDSTAASSGNSLVRRHVALSKRSTTGSAACYASVVNSQSSFVGQLRGDCLLYEPNVVMTGVELCMSLKSSIPHDATNYPNFGTALLTTDPNGNTVYTASSTLVTSDLGTDFCVTVNNPGTYCPVSLKSNWQSSVGSTKPVCNQAQQVAVAVQQAVAIMFQNTTQLKITAQPPASITAGAAFGLTVELLDDNGMLQSDATGTVTLTLVTDDQSVVSLKGTQLQNAVSGRAVFTGVIVERAGAGYRIVVSGSNVRSDTSTAFAVQPSTAAKLAFSKQPAGALKNQPWVNQPEVQLQDQYDNPVTNGPSISVSVTAVVSGTPVALLGTTTSATANGLAKFSNLRIDALLNGVRLTASSPNMNSGTSDEFNVVPLNGYPFRLAFSVNPVANVSGSPFTTQPEVQILDGNFTVVPSATNLVTLSLAGNATTAQLGGAVSKSASGGQAVFSGLYLSRAGVGFQLVASSQGLLGANSALFDVNGAASLGVSILAGSAITTVTKFTVRVTVLDLNGMPYSDMSENITLAIKSGTGASGAKINGIVSRRPTHGVSTFSEISISAGSEGYVLTAATATGLQGQSNAFKVTQSNETLTPPPSARDNAESFFTPTVIAIIAGSCVGLWVIMGLVVMHIRQKSRKRKNKVAPMIQPVFIQPVMLDQELESQIEYVPSQRRSVQVDPRRVSQATSYHSGRVVQQPIRVPVPSYQNAGYDDDDGSSYEEPRMQQRVQPRVQAYPVYVAQPRGQMRPPRNGY